MENEQRIPRRSMLAGIDALRLVALTFHLECLHTYAPLVTIRNVLLDKFKIINVLIVTVK